MPQKFAYSTEICCGITEPLIPGHRNWTEFNINCFVQTQVAQDIFHNLNCFCNLFIKVSQRDLRAHYFSTHQKRKKINKNTVVKYFPR